MTLGSVSSSRACSLARPRPTSRRWWRSPRTVPRRPRPRPARRPGRARPRHVDWPSAATGSASRRRSCSSPQPTTEPPATRTRGVRAGRARRPRAAGTGTAAPPRPPAGRVRPRPCAAHGAAVGLGDAAAYHVCTPSSSAAQGDHQQRDQQRLRAAHHVVPGGQPDEVDVDAEVVVLRPGGDVAEVEEQRGDRSGRRDDAAADGQPPLDLATGCSAMSVYSLALGSGAIRVRRCSVGAAVGARRRCCRRGVVRAAAVSVRAVVRRASVPVGIDTRTGHRCVQVERQHGLAGNRRDEVVAAVVADRTAVDASAQRERVRRAVRVRAWDRCHGEVADPRVGREHEAGAGRSVVVTAGRRHGEHRPVRSRRPSRPPRSRAPGRRSRTGRSS